MQCLNLDQVNHSPMFNFFHFNDSWMAGISFLNPYIKGANNLAPQQQSCLPFFPSHFLIIFRNQSCLAIFRFWVSEIVVHELEEKGSIATVYIMLK
ncbi:hypothetical protein P8452_65507 [Trifolium repens]|nr:hypothetical protein P8452_65507 [Trifolium repens]